MFSGTALSGASNGVFVKTKPDVEYTNALTFADIVSLESTVMDAGVDVTDGTAAYVCTPKVYGALKSTPKAAGAAEMICQNGIRFLLLTTWTPILSDSVYSPTLLSVSSAIWI